MSDEALSKTGPELFRELLRLYDTAEPEDYMKGNAWKDELLKMDIVLVEAHRKEAGAPDPPDLEDVEMPDMNPLPMSVGATGVARPGVISVPATNSAGLGAASAAAGGPVAELRLIALFVAKWKLDPSSTKLLLAKLTPQRRRHVMQFFKSTGTGEAATTELQAFITQCEASGDWDKGATVAPTLVAAGVKRPILALNPAMDASKRPHLAAPSLQSPAGNLAARLAAARAGGARPVSPRPVLTVSPSGTRPPMQVGMMGGVRPAGMVRPMGQQPGAMQAWGAGQQAWGAAQHAGGKGGAPPGNMIRNLLGRM